MLTERAARAVSNHPTLEAALASCEGDPTEKTAAGHKGVRPWVCRVSQEGRRIEAWVAIHGEATAGKGLSPEESQMASEWAQRRVDAVAVAAQRFACAA